MFSQETTLKLHFSLSLCLFFSLSLCFFLSLSSLSLCLSLCLFLYLSHFLSFSLLLNWTARQYNFQHSHSLDKVVQASLELCVSVWWVQTKNKTCQALSTVTRLGCWVYFSPASGCPCLTLPCAGLFYQSGGGFFFSLWCSRLQNSADRSDQVKCVFSFAPHWVWFGSTGLSTAKFSRGPLEISVGLSFRVSLVFNTWRGARLVVWWLRLSGQAHSQSAADCVSDCGVISCLFVPLHSRR